MTDAEIIALAKANGMVEEYWMTKPPKFGAAWMTPDGVVSFARALISSATKTVIFRALTDQDGQRDGEGGWEVLIDGEVVIDEVRSDDLDISSNAFKELWEALNVRLEFDQE